MDKKIAMWIGIFGLIFTLIASFVTTMSNMLWLAVIAGLILGFMIGRADVKLFLAVLAIAGVSTALALIPSFGVWLSTLFRNLAIFAGSIIAIPALKVIINRLGIKWK